MCFFFLRHAVMRLNFLIKSLALMFTFGVKLARYLFLTFKCTEPSQNINLASFIHASLQMKPSPGTGVVI